eukprot:CAMPEP_0170754186 /NCGR_PEP_ID=MMETSP0437-20130122/12876_1 /TAXON_ID=0 /ORGANISM="Sexangularia sp." /LENGTH=47 /DNA_ID= /DNA_START= /DNA_END= /DNA_ORIENTATION=
MSVMAGVTCTEIRERFALPPNRAVVLRTMPNVYCAHDAGAMATYLDW